MVVIPSKTYSHAFLKETEKGDTNYYRKAGESQKPEKI
jgi:hypothetical protein